MNVNDVICHTSSGPNMNNNLYYSLSDRKIRVPTSESNESNNSAQFNYMRHPQNIMGMNLNQKFSNNNNNTNNMQFYYDEE